MRILACLAFEHDWRLVLLAAPQLARLERQLETAF